MSAIAGRVLLLPKGAYNALTTYNPLDFVTYGADSYVCKQTSTGNAPTNTTYWQLLAKGSTDADQIGYDNTASGLSATDVQAAVDELASEKQDKDLSTPIVVGGVSKTTVEDTLSGLNEYADDITDVISKNGAVNLLQNTAESKVDSGVTFTVNADKTVSLSGTASADSALRVNNLTLKAGRYKVVGTPTGGGDTTYQIWLHNTDGLNIDEYGDGTVFTLSADTLVLCDIYIHNGANVTGKVFKPMITLASQHVSYNDYVPYAKTNQELTQVTSGLTNPNLLDNPWFTVNQRGTTSGSITPNAFIVDRWKMDYGETGGTYNVTSNGITLTPSGADYNYIKQTLENVAFFNGKQVTLSVMLSSGTIYSYSFIRANGTSQSYTENNIQLQWYSNDNIMFRVLNGNSAAFRAVKLELGSHSTLHLDAAPNYTTELLKCQRYFKRIALNITNQAFAFGMALDTTNTRFILEPSVPMRATPSLTYSGSFVVDDGLANKTVTGIVLVNSSGNLQQLSVTTSQTVTIGSVVRIYASASGSYLDLSAEL